MSTEHLQVTAIAPNITGGRIEMPSHGDERFTISIAESQDVIETDARKEDDLHESASPSHVKTNAGRHMHEGGNVWSSDPYGFPQSAGVRSMSKRPISNASLRLTAASGNPDGPLGSRRAVPVNIDQVAPFWERYNKAADFEDREFVQAITGNLDNHLIFAGLFSGVNTAFIVEALKTVQLDQPSRTNELVLSIISALNNNTSTPVVPYYIPFKPDPQNVRSTAMFFASLCCSLSAAFGAVLAKQWLNHYEREGGLKPPPGRGRERQRKYQARSQWHMEGIIETLPTLLQISLFLFLIALVEFLWTISQIISWLVMGFSLVPILFYVNTITIATIFPLSPFQTRLSLTIRKTAKAIYIRYLKIRKSLPGIPLYLFTLLGNLIVQGFTVFRALKLQVVVSRLPNIINTVCLLVLVALFIPFCLMWQVLIYFPRRLLRLLGRVPTPADALLDWNCLIFYTERATAPEDIHHVLVAMDAVPLRAEQQEPNPVIGPLSETLIKFVIKPTWDPEFHTYITPLDTGEFRYLVKCLHLLHSSWKRLDAPHHDRYAAPYFVVYRQLIRSNLWAVFARDSFNVDLARLIADILGATDAYSQQDPSESYQELILECLQRPALDSIHYLPYINLLALQSPPNRFAQSKDWGNVAHVLTSTMWKDGEADPDHTRGLIRAEVLPMHLGETELDLRFSQYLSECCENYLVDQRSNLRFVSHAANQAAPCYLKAIHILLQRYNNSPLWPAQFEADDIPFLLLQIIKHSRWSSHAALAISTFLSLWWRRNTAGEQITASNEPSPYLTPDAVATIAEHLWSVPYIWSEDLERLDEAQLSHIMEYIVEYFEAASRSRMLRPGMASIVPEYQKAGEWLLQDFPEQHQQLYERMANLNFG